MGRGAHQEPTPRGRARSAGPGARLEHAQQPEAAGLFPAPIARVGAGQRRLLPPLLQHPEPARAADRRPATDGVVQRRGRRHAGRPEPRGLPGTLRAECPLSDSEHGMGR